MLVTLKVSNAGLNAGQQTAIQSALTNVAAIERTVEAGLNEPASLRSARFNRIVSRDIDRLLTVLEEVKIARAGVGP